MQEKMNEQYQQQQQAQAATPNDQSSSNSRVPSGDYIDFEEVK